MSLQTNTSTRNAIRLAFLQKFFENKLSVVAVLAKTQSRSDASARSLPFGACAGVEQYASTAGCRLLLAKNARASAPGAVMILRHLSP
ncbi:hypothetical protein [Caenimonas koreensis]|uniref:Uncharacterized protein n=1 Tax=Caenimonas koreensis DSM 17982 TaxID=1121255 RepID=A0A844BB41_9BURK|nr:hypothetical protein [Caenimonas koreensis]MRD48667.1 hypothetical protein [Caenimonas koreensis DSM 17982]